MVIKIILEGKALGLAYDRGYRYTGGTLNGSIEINTEPNYSNRAEFNAAKEPGEFVFLNYENQYKQPENSTYEDLLTSSQFLTETTSLMSKALGTQTLVSILEGQKNEKNQNSRSEKGFTTIQSTWFDLRQLMPSFK